MESSATYGEFGHIWKVRPQALGEGLHIVNPLLNFTSFDLRAVTETWNLYRPILHG